MATMPEIKRRKVEVASVDIQHAVTSVEGVLEVDGSREATVEEKNGRPLADIIKAHHATLRQRADESGPAVAWAENASQSTALVVYADAMYHLATTHWTADGNTRLTWCRDTIAAYFHAGGQSTAIAKDARRIAHQKRRAHAAAAAEDLSLPGATADIPATPSVAGPAPVDAQPTPTVPDAPHTLCNQHTAVNVDATHLARRLRVLDVGSCYDPFAQFEAELEVTAIDLCPAASAPGNVHACDFLTVPVTLRADQGLPLISATPTPAGSALSAAEQRLGVVYLEEKPGAQEAPKRGCHSVTAIRAASCDAVVFCLLLSYMPTPELRLEACRRARAVLRPQGLLVVVTPDSSHVGKGAGRMKRWKASIEALGFRRWRYTKLKHTHCMAFRAVSVDDTHLPTVGADELASGIVLQCEL